jgi:hypothetical protein
MTKSMGYRILVYGTSNAADLFTVSTDYLLRDDIPTDSDVV